MATSGSFSVDALVFLNSAKEGRLETMQSLFGIDVDVVRSQQLLKEEKDEDGRSAFLIGCAMENVIDFLIDSGLM
jgi:hypothetical protein